MDQVIALLRQRGRLTYRTLQRQFQLDDAVLDDLKDELIFGQRLAIDEEGCVLVWTGEPAAPKPDAQRRAAAESRFHAMLSAVMWWLQRGGRMTSRPLQHFLGIDDGLLREIGEDLFFRRLAMGEDGKGLVWRGEAPPFLPPRVEVPTQPATADTTEVPSPTVF